jgi:hypothetical protein
MQLDRRHLIGSAVLLAGSIVYNVWVFWGPASEDSASASASRPAVEGQASSGASGAPAPIDPRQIPPPPAVDLTLTPEWSRDPFRVTGDIPLPPAPADAPPAGVEAPEPVVGAILFSPERRLAIVNGTTVGIGDRIDAGVIVDITRDAILVRHDSGGQVRQLTLTRSNPRDHKK